MAVLYGKFLGSVLVSAVLAGTPAPSNADTEHSEKESLRLVTGPHYPPFAADDLPFNGLAPFLVSRIFESGGRKVTVDLLPWKRAYRDTLKDEYDAILPHVESPARQDDYLFSVPIFNVDAFAYVSADSPISAQTPEGLEGLTYCNPVGFKDGVVLERLRLNERVKRVTPANMNNCFKMLHAGRVDFVKTNPHVARYIMMHLELPRNLFRRLPFTVEHTSLHLMVPKGRSGAEALIREFNALFNDLVRRGQLQPLAGIYLEQLNMDRDWAGAKRAD